MKNKDMYETIMSSLRVIETPNQTGITELRNALSLMFNNKRNLDKMFLLTIKKFNGSESNKSLKFRLKKLCRDLRKIFFKFDYLFTIEIDNENTNANIDFVRETPSFHTHMIICTNQSAKNIKETIRKLSERKDIDIHCIEIGMTNFDLSNTLNYVSKEIEYMGYDTYDFKIPNIVSPSN